MSASAMNSRCFWPPESVMNHGVALVAQAELLEQRSPSTGCR